MYAIRSYYGIFDDENPETVKNWFYPDTKKWDADRNTQEFIDNMPVWKAYGLLSFTINLQGGSPYGYRITSYNVCYTKLLRVYVSKCRDLFTVISFTIMLAKIKF